MKAHFQMFADYNAWANERLYAAAGQLSKKDVEADLGAFFGSVLGTLNHIMIADLLWLARLREQRPPNFALIDILHDDMAELTAARRVLDADIVRYADDLTEADLTANITYTTITGPTTMTQRRDHALPHFFNHQTHHRGQVHALLTRLTGDAPPLDLLFYQREMA
ncbi:MAG: DinB family protein [Pseudomonadota bacterium]